VLPWASWIGSSSATINLSTSYSGLRVGVTDRICSGICTATLVVAEPSQPCGTLIVAMVKAPAVTVSGETVTWAWAGPATSTPAPRAAAHAAAARTCPVLAMPVSVVPGG
jgi:hypothetical protein